MFVFGALQGLGSILPTFSVIEHQAQALVFIVLFVFDLPRFFEARSDGQFLITRFFGCRVVRVDLAAHLGELGAFIHDIQALHHLRIRLVLSHGHQATPKDAKKENVFHVSEVSTNRRPKAKKADDCISLSLDAVRGNSCDMGPWV